jgi:hypothetical protein
VFSPKKEIKQVYYTICTAEKWAKKNMRTKFMCRGFAEQKICPQQNATEICKFQEMEEKCCWNVYLSERKA